VVKKLKLGRDVPAELCSDEPIVSENTHSSAEISNSEECSIVMKEKKRKNTSTILDIMDCCCDIGCPQKVCKKQSISPRQFSRKDFVHWKKRRWHHVIDSGLKFIKMDYVTPPCGSQLK